MINKIIAFTRGEPCSCLEHRHCVGCKLKSLKPQVYLEEPHKLEIPIVINHYKPKKAVKVRSTSDGGRPFWKKRKHSKTPDITTGLCSWYKKKLALRQLQLERQKEEKRIRQEIYAKAQKEREEELLEQLRRQEYSKNKQKCVSSSAVNQSAKSVPKLRRNSPRVKSTIAKPKSRSKQVTVTTFNHHQSLGQRFVNCMYRACCQFLCCVSLLLVVAFVAIILI